VRSGGAGDTSNLMAVGLTTIPLGVYTVNMQIIPEPTEFEWDEGNLNKNQLKHEVENQEIEEVFFNLPVLVLPDQQHSKTEVRYLILGQTDKKRRLSIIFTIRKTKIRVISARPMSIKEKKFYETR